MISKKDFKEKISGLLSDEKKIKFEKTRKNAEKYQKAENWSFAATFILPLVIAGIIALIYICGVYKPILFSLVIIAFIVPFGLNFYFSNREVQLNKAYKKLKAEYIEEVLRILLKDYNYSYFAEKEIEPKYFYESGFYPAKGFSHYYTKPMQNEKFKRYFDNNRQKLVGYEMNKQTVEDLVEITFPETNKSSALKLALFDLGLNNSSRNKDAFSGVFGFVEFPENFNFRISINSRIEGLEKLQLEDVVFNKDFEVKTNNQFETLYILTPKIMRNLQKFQEKTSKKLRFSIIYNHLYIGIENTDFFEFYKKSLSMDQFEKIYDEVNIIISLVEEISKNKTLNKRV